MRIYNISSDNFAGGAARAGYRQHLALRSELIDSNWFHTGHEDAERQTYRLSIPTRKKTLPSRVASRMRRIWTARSTAKVTSYFSLPTGVGVPEIFESLPIPDVWNLHWVAHFLDWKTTLPWLAERAPIVWTLHDENPFSGIWHYSRNPANCNSRELALNRKVLEYKRKILEQMPNGKLTFVAPSRWMQRACQESQLTSRFETVNIPYGVDTETFLPMDMGLCRNVLGVPADAKVVGFVANEVDDPRKGMKELAECVDLLENKEEWILLTVGSGRPISTRIRQINLGPLRSDRLLSVFYSSCDVFACPSLQDNLPNTLLESIACGTPVIGFNTGGIPDVVESDRTGSVCELGDVASFGLALMRLTEVGKSGAIRETCRRVARETYSFQNNATRYLELYGRILGNLGPTT